MNENNLPFILIILNLSLIPLFLLRNFLKTSCIGSILFNFLNQKSQLIPLTFLSWTFRIFIILDLFSFLSQTIGVKIISWTILFYVNYIHFLIISLLDIFLWILFLLVTLILLFDRTVTFVRIFKWFYTLFAPWL